MKKHLSTALIIFVAVLLMSACTLLPELVTQAPTVAPTKAATVSSTPLPVPTNTQTINPTSTPWPLVSSGEVQVHSMNIRSGPGTDNPAIGIVKKGEEILLLGEFINDDDQKWLLILMTNDSFGWIMGDPFYISEKLVSVSYMTYETLLRVANESINFIDQPYIPTPDNSLPVSTSESQAVDNLQTYEQFCADTLKSVGSTVTCKIPQAYCTYQSGLFGKPTFCNDAGSSIYNFTLATWGSDWTDYDGSCIIVTGFVSLYAGKPQIEASDRSQVSICP